MLHCKDKQIWSTNTSNSSIEYLYFGKNNTLSLRKKENISVWEAEFTRKDSEPEELVLQDDGNVVVYDKCDEILWESETSGKCNVIPGMYLYCGILTNYFIFINLWLLLLLI